MRSAPFRSRPNETVTLLSRNRAVNPPPSAADATRSLFGTSPTCTPACSRQARVAASEYVFVPPPQPALLHGDLWDGNVLVGPGGAPALIDPAASYGDREAELVQSNRELEETNRGVLALYAELDEKATDLLVHSLDRAPQLVVRVLRERPADPLQP